MRLWTISITAIEVSTSHTQSHKTFSESSSGSSSGSFMSATSGSPNHSFSNFKRRSRTNLAISAQLMLRDKNNCCHRWNRSWSRRVRTVETLAHLDNGQPRRPDEVQDWCVTSTHLVLCSPPDAASNHEPSVRMAAPWLEDDAKDYDGDQQTGKRGRHEVFGIYGFRAPSRRSLS